MEHFFELSVLSGSELRNFNTRLVIFGYVYKFYVMIDNQEYEFERDEERNYRVINMMDNIDEQADQKLIEAIIPYRIIVLTLK